MIQQSNARVWWEILLDSGAAAATIAVTCFAAVQLCREVGRERRAQRAADARAAELAFRLRRQLLSWVGEPRDPDGLSGWMERVTAAGTYVDHVDRAEQHVVALMGSTSETSDRVAEGIRAAYILFLAGTNRINRLLSGDEGRERDEWLEWGLIRGAAGKDLRACIAVLEAGVIDRDLLRAERQFREGARGRGPVPPTRWCNDSRGERGDRRIRAGADPAHTNDRGGLAPASTVGRMDAGGTPG